MGPQDFLKGIGAEKEVLSFDLLGLLKLPLIIVLLSNIIFSLLLFLRVRILADTFKSPENKVVKTIVLMYILLTTACTLLSLLFVILS